MPQMMPMEWLMLYATFLTTFLMFNIMNYFNQSPPNKQESNKSNITSNKMSWKW
uniref:ATP synthase complex subunit 8 n=1 Tax=Macrotermes carbonarius TaxID=144742 RepID=A0A1S5VMC3_9NEOP|nr:ATP synthase F0 subunit 8 [Macrotermes carbonarius]AQP27095.1 ATP synthase F0 subunit 8 [Macrotermes carbonarius]AQP28803.1 ATP synthase F0 subunit 8 [Macrotermes carbonarius]